MRKQVAKGLGYALTPRLARVAMSPGKAAIGTATSWAMNRMLPPRRRSSRQLGAIGLGAAALALPIGIWIGRRMKGADRQNHTYRAF